MRFAAFLLLTLASSLAPLSHLAHAHEIDSAVQSPRAEAGGDRDDELLSQLTRWVGDRGIRMEERLEAAEIRQRWLAELMEKNPGAVLRQAMSAAARAALAPELQALVESEESHEGTLEVFHSDGPQGGAYHYALRQPKGRSLRLRFAGLAPELTTGTRVRVSGVRVAEALALGGGQSGLTVLGLPVLPSTFGEHKVLVILLRFLDTPASASPPVSSVQSTMFGTTGSTVNTFFRENSYQQTWFTGTVVGPLVIPINSSGCDTAKIASLAQQAVAAVGGIVPSQFRHVVYAFPNSGCAWWGYGSIGGLPGQVWINGSLTPVVAAHELGHNLGLYHSHALECGAVTMGGSCSSIDYGDVFDVMGSGNGPTHLNAVQKDLLGWLGYGASPPITEVTSSGTYTLEPLETSGTNPKALRIKTAAGDWLYVEYRRPVGFDSYLSNNPNVTGGVLVHYFNGSADGVYLLDMTPATSSWNDPALAVGATFQDTVGKVGITTAWVNGTTAGVTVAVNGPACVRAAPTVTLDPALQAGQAGATLTYGVYVRNNGSGCGASVFGLSLALPGGFSATINSPALTIAEGATASTLIQVTPSAAVAAGAYPLTVSTSEAGLTGSAGATYTVAQAPQPPAPPPGAAGSFTDGFDRANASALGNGWTAATGSFKIVSGEARNDVAKVLHVAVQPTLTGATQTASATFASVNNNLAPRFGVVLRYRDAGNFYVCYRLIGGSSVMRIAKVVNGVETVLKQAGVPNPAQNATFTVSCDVTGNGLAVKLDGVVKASATDAAFASGSVGFAMGGTTGGAASHRADNFSASVQ